MKTTTGAALLSAYLLLTGCGGEGGGGTYTFEVTSDTATEASITYPSDGVGSSSQETAATLPWSQDVTIEGDVVALSVLAQQPGDAVGSITCVIRSGGGEVLAENTSAGPGAIAQCTTEG